MKSVTKWLTDPDADEHPFPHKIGERLRSPSKSLEGIVRNAKYAGTSGGLRLTDWKWGFPFSYDQSRLCGKADSHRINKLGQRSSWDMKMAGLAKPGV